MAPSRHSPVQPFPDPSFEYGCPSGLWGHSDMGPPQAPASGALGGFVQSGPDGFARGVLHRVAGFRIL